MLGVKAAQRGMIMNINRGWIGDIAVVMACYAILVYLCRVVLPKKYRYMQEGLASFVVWASAVTAIIWLMGKKNTIGIMMGSLGLSGIELPFFSVCDTADESDVYAHVCQYGIWAVFFGVSYF